MSLVEFLLARISEDEQRAASVPGGCWTVAEHRDVWSTPALYAVEATGATSWHCAR